MNCPFCGGGDLKVDLCSRDLMSGYFLHGDCTDTGDAESVKTWFTKHANFKCYTCSSEENIKYLKGKLAYPVMDDYGKRKVKFKQVNYKKQRISSRGDGVSSQRG